MIKTETGCLRVDDACLCEGRIIAGVGGLYTVRDADGNTYRCRAKGTFRHDGMLPLVGDKVTFLKPQGETEEDATGGRIEGILARKNALIRPAMANLDVLFFIIAAKDPDPSLRFIDKLLAILEYQRIECVIVVTKCDLDGEKAGKLRIKYEKCGYRVIETDENGGAETGGDGALSAYLKTFDKNTLAAFSGVSGAGKSTLFNRLIPELALETGSISERIARGRHTTRAVSLYDLDARSGGIYHGLLADTPGFSMLDFAQFDFFSCGDLPYTFREFLPYLGKCRYTKCTHTVEDGCAVCAAVKEKRIPKSRHTSYVELYDILKKKKDYT